MILTVAILLLIMGPGIMVFWAIHIGTGGLPHGLRTLESDGYIVFHIAAETIMSIACIASGVALLIGVGWGIPVGLVANGLLVYAGVNSLAWKGVRQNHFWFVVFGLVTIIAFMNIGLLLASYRPI